VAGWAVALALGAAGASVADPQPEAPNAQPQAPDARPEAGDPQPEAGDPPLRLLRSEVVVIGASSVTNRPALAYRLPLELVVVAGSGWSVERIVASARQAGAILRQCGIDVEPARLTEVDGPLRFRFLQSHASRELARRVNPGRPALFFVADTLQRPAFDAEAIGRANSRTRAEMTDTVWITAGTRDLPIVIAHELVHVLADSGEHSAEPENLMRDETAPANVRLTGAQCRAIVSRASENGLLRRAP
jgi:hypothetical protein